METEAERERIRKSIHLKAVKIFNPEDGVGTLAQFDAVISGMLTLKALRLVRGENTEVRVHPPRLNGGARSADLPTWLRTAICNAAIESVQLPAAGVPPADMPLPDAAALPKGLMRAVRV